MEPRSEERYEKNTVKQVLLSIAAAITVALIASQGPSLAAKKKKAAASSTALALVVGNPATDGKAVDSYSNFTVIDTNHPVSATGFVSIFQYYAENKKPFEFVLVDKDNTVEWLSPTITPAATGVQSYTTASPVPVQAGWNLGVHSDSTGVIPYSTTGKAIVTTANGAGKPAVGSKLAPYNIPSQTFNRTYSMNASAAAAAEAESKAGKEKAEKEKSAKSGGGKEKGGSGKEKSGSAKGGSKSKATATSSSAAAAAAAAASSSSNSSGSSNSSSSSSNNSSSGSSSNGSSGSSSGGSSGGSSSGGSSSGGSSGGSSSGSGGSGSGSGSSSD
ncbi:MAG TPA: hypothetical protein VHY82_14295 [Acetobacteraceae bacterium]|jgi:hypothetical protein|nr:hypothetical protein [Acetobacteraceae bacterium]